MNCSIYKNALDNSGATVQVATVLANIKLGRWEKQILAIRNSEKVIRDELKKGLPAAAFSGVFHPTRSKTNVTAYNQLVVIDIDHVDEAQMQVLLPALRADAHVMACWRSPSGDGVKGLVPVTSDLEHHLDAFECVSMYMETNYAVSIDKSGKDECRLCFVSYDPALHYRHDAIPMVIEYRAEARKSVYGDRDMSRKGLSLTDDDRVKYEVCRRWAEYHRPYESGNRNNHVFVCACNMNRTGIEFERAVVLVIADRTDMPVAEIKAIIQKVYRGKTKEFATVTVYDFEKEQEANKEAMKTMGLEEILDGMFDMAYEEAISTGDTEMDAAIGGLSRGNLYGFIGMQKTYKSSFVAGMSRRIAREHGPVLYLSGEMSKVQATRILLMGETGVDIDNKEQLAANRERLKEAVAFLKRIVIVDDGEFNKASVMATCKKVEDEMGQPIAFLVVDGIQNWRKIRGTEHEQDGNSTKEMKQIAKELNIPVGVLIHTDANCKPWSRQPQAFVRSKVVVLRNLDASFGFSRFLDASTSFQNGDANQYEMRMDISHVKMIDDRKSGKIVDRVYEIKNLNFTPRADLSASQFEVVPTNNDGYASR